MKKQIKKYLQCPLCKQACKEDLKFKKHSKQQRFFCHCLCQTSDCYIIYHYRGIITAFFIILNNIAFDYYDECWEIILYDNVYKEIDMDGSDQYFLSPHDGFRLLQRYNKLLVFS